MVGAILITLLSSVLSVMQMPEAGRQIIYGLVIIVMLLAMVVTSLWGWTIERVAYRPLRGSFRLAPLILVKLPAT